MPNRCHILRRSVALVAVALAVVVPFDPVGSVQDPRDRDLEVVQLDTSSHPELTATVSAPSALSARTLADEAFRVTEGSERLPVTAEAIDLDELEVVLAVDPGAGNTGLRSVQGAALELINLTMPRLPLTVVAAGSPPTVVMSRSRDAAEATASIGALRPASDDRGDTLDALALAMDQVDEQESSGTLVVLIAASATGSAADAGELADRAGSAQIPFEVILPGERETPAAYASLDDLPTGNVIVTPSTEDVVGALDRITTDLAGRYRLRFRVSDPTPAGPQPLIIGVDAYGIIAEVRVPVEGAAVTTGGSTAVTATVPARADSDSGNGSGNASGGGSSSGWLVVAIIAAVLILILVMLAVLFGRDRSRIVELYPRRKARPEPRSATSSESMEHVISPGPVIDLRDNQPLNGSTGPGAPGPSLAPGVAVLAKSAPSVTAVITAHDSEPEVVISFRPRQVRAAAASATRAPERRGLLRRIRSRATGPTPLPDNPIGPFAENVRTDGSPSLGAASSPQNQAAGPKIGQNGRDSHPFAPDKVLPAVEPTPNEPEHRPPTPPADGRGEGLGDTGAPPIPALAGGPQLETPGDEVPASGLRGLLRRLRPTALEPIGSTIARSEVSGASPARSSMDRSSVEPTIPPSSPFDSLGPVRTHDVEPAPVNGRPPADLVADPPTPGPAPVVASIETGAAPPVAKGPVRPRPQPEVVAEADKVDRSRPGARWWEYQRSDDQDERDGPPSPEATPAGGPVAGVAGSSGPPASNDPPELDSASDEPPQRAEVSLAESSDQSLMPLFVLGGGLLVTAIVVARFRIVSLGPFLIPAGALALAVAFGRRIVRTRPDEPWVGRFIVYGVIAKLVASYARYLTLVLSYEGRGDAADYHDHGRLLAKAWMGDGQAPFLYDLRESNFVRWFTGVVYYLFGPNFMVGFFVFGLLALIGSYFWYRATVSAVPFIDKRLYLALVLFVPSIVFWPSSIGKESLMQLGIGTVTLGIALLMRTRLLAGLVVAVAGGWLLWVVRPHLLAMVAVSGGVAYAVGRVRQKDGATGSIMSRPAGIIIVAFLVIFTISQGAEMLGLEELSLTSIENELDATTESTSQGGSEYDTGGNSLNPLTLPQGAVTVLLRPFPWETDSPLQLLASAESALLAIALVLRFGSLRVALSRSRTQPFLMYCWIVVAIYAATFSSFANFGLLVRQRSLVLPALYVLLAVSPSAARAYSARHDPATGTVPQAVGAN